MNLGQTRHGAFNIVAALVAAFLLVFALQGVSAQDAVGTTSTQVEGTEVDLGSPEAAVALGEGLVGDEVGDTLAGQMAPTPGKGMPVDRGMTFQDQYTEIGRDALFMHDAFLVPMMAGVSLLVLGLLLWVVVRYRRREGREPSRTTHNTFVEVVWTLLPVLVLVAIAIPSISLLAKQYETPPEDAVTIKATGYQWYWGYSYPDHGDFEIISNMLSEADAVANGEPALLAVDNRMVVPANTPIRLQTTAADVIHAFAVPSLWFKLDAVPGRLNERMLIIDEPGVYYGQCSELCGARHGFMPIAVEALPRDEWEAWVLAQPGGTLGEEETAAEDDAESEADALEAGDADAADEAAEAEADAA